MKVIWYSAVNILLKEGEEREVEPGALCIKTLNIYFSILQGYVHIYAYLLILGDGPVVDQGVVVEE